MAEDEARGCHYVQSGRGKLKRVGGRHALYVEEQKGIHVLNETAYLLYQALDEPATVAELVAALSDLVRVDAAMLEHDIEEAVALLVDNGLVRISG